MMTMAKGKKKPTLGKNNNVQESHLLIYPLGNETPSEQPQVMYIIGGHGNWMKVKVRKQGGCLAGTHSSVIIVPCDPKRA